MAPILPSLLAQDDGQLFLGEDFFAWMVLAFGAAMVVGNILALVRPPEGADEDRAAPVGRSATLIVVGLAAALWGLASLLSS